MATIFSIVIVVTFAALAGYPLVHPGLHPTHDGEYHIIRFYEFAKTLQDGEIYPRWAPDLNNGYGVPLFNYVYPLPNYISFILHALGLSFIDTFKASLFIATVIGAVFFYLWSKKLWGNTGGVVGSIFYTYSPYHFVDIYIRGSVGEVWALAFFPFVLWGVHKSLQEKNKLFTVLSGLFFALIVFSHNILALIFFIFIVSYIGFIFIDSKQKHYIVLHSFLIIGIGLSISMIFWLPAVSERNFSVGLQIYNFRNNFPEAYELLFPSWGTGFSDGIFSNKMSHQIGIANLLAFFLSIPVGIILYINRKFNSAKIVTFFLTLFLIVLFLMLKISLPIWNTIPFMNYFQFPWRLLSIEILVASVLVGSIFKLWNSKIIALLLILFAVLISIRYTKPAYYHLRDDNYYTTRPNFIHGTNSPGNVFNTIWFNPTLKKTDEKISDNVLKVKSKLIKSTYYRFDVFNSKEGIININTAYFPGWNVFVDKEQVKAAYNKDGLISFNLTRGDHVVEARFINTSIRTVSTIITASSLVCILALFTRSVYVKIKG